jgi:hypothetical protein
MPAIHPFYESHRGAMEAAMRHRLDLAEAMLCERARLSDIDGIRREVMDEFEIVLTQMPYVGGAASRMSDFFMRLMGFMAISRVLRRHGVSLSVIGEIERGNLQGAIAHRARSGTSRLGASIHVARESDFAARAGYKERYKKPSERVSGRFRLRFRRAGPG